MHACRQPLASIYIYIFMKYIVTKIVLSSFKVVLAATMAQTGASQDRYFSYYSTAPDRGNVGT